MHAKSAGRGRDPEAGWSLARVGRSRYPELVTPHGDGPTPAEAIADAEVSKELFFESCLEHGDPIPEPGDGDRYSGTFLVRGPKSLHRALTERAIEEGVSLNQLVVARLAGDVGMGERDRTG